MAILPLWFLILNLIQGSWKCKRLGLSVSYFNHSFFYDSGDESQKDDSFIQANLEKGVGGVRNSQEW